MQCDWLKLLVILYSLDTQYSFAYFTVKTKVYDRIISHTVQLSLLFKKIISLCLNFIVEQYKIIAKFGTFFLSHLVYNMPAGHKNHSLHHDAIKNSIHTQVLPADR